MVEAILTDTVISGHLSTALTKSCLNKRLHSIFDISVSEQSPELTRMLPMTCTVLNHVFFYF